MVKCSNCGVEIPDTIKLCPNCGSEVVENEDAEISNGSCPQCGSDIKDGEMFCQTCGSKVGNIEINNKKPCPNCGAMLEKESAFCDECGFNLNSVEKTSVQKIDLNQNFLDKIDFNVLFVPTVISLIVVFILSCIGLVLGFSWLSFYIAIILSVLFFAATLDNEVNGVVLGLITGLILGLLERSIVDLIFGAFVAVFYQGFFGGNLIQLIILGVIMGYVGNAYLKDPVRSFLDKHNINWL